MAQRVVPADVGVSRGGGGPPPQVARASMGVVNHINIVQTVNLVEAANQLKAIGLPLIALCAMLRQEGISVP